MKHYGIAQWVDYSRDVVRDGDAAVMQAHLLSGCAECGDLSSFFNRLSGVCREMSPIAVPEGVLKRAWAIFPAVARPRKRVFRIPVELIYDSFLMPAPAGLRSTWQVGWQGLYRAGDCSLDLRIEPELRTSRASVIGQISNHITPEEQMAGLPVRIKSGRLTVAETRSNPFGEFQMDYEQQKRLQLCIYLDGGDRAIQVALKRVAERKRRGE